MQQYNQSINLLDKNAISVFIGKFLYKASFFDRRTLKVKML